MYKKHKKKKIVNEINSKRSLSFAKIFILKDNDWW